MTSILDQILASYETPRVIGEEHDVNNIAVGGGVGGIMAQRQAQIDSLRNGGGWDEAEYGRSRQAQIAMLEAANTPEAAEKALAEMRQQAIRRAGLDTSTGRVAVMVAGKAPWHKLGVNVAEAVSSADAIRLASLDWRAEKTPMAYRGPMQEWRESKDVFALTRSDTGAMLGSVGSRYQPIQNSEGFKFLDSLLSAFGAKYESAGAIYGGKKVWMLVHLPQQSFTVGHSDRVEPYAIFTNPHDGSGSAYCYPTSERVVCANTLRVSLGGKSKGIAIRHTGNIEARMGDAAEALGLAVEGFGDFAAKSEVLARTPVTSIRHYCNDVLDAALDVTEAQCLLGADALAAALKVTEASRALEAKSFERKIERRGEILEDILSRYESGRCGLNGQRGTAWAALNAVTESADHGKLGGRYVGGEEAKASRRFESVISGPADEVKQVAYAKALALAS